MSPSHDEQRTDHGAGSDPTAIQLRRYLADQAHWRNVLYVAAGGVGMALALWVWRDQSSLFAAVAQDRLPTFGAAMVWTLLSSLVFAQLLWLVLATIIVKTGRLSLEKALGRLSALFLASTLLALLPILAVDGVETEAVGMLGALAGIIALVAWLATSEFLRHVEPETLSRLTKRAHAQTGLALTVVLIAVYTAFMIWLSLTRHARFSTFAFDLGIQDQVLFNIVTSGRMVTTLLGPSERIYDHFSPLFYLLAPVYALFQNATTLLVLQTLALGIGAVAIYLLAQKKTTSAILGVALAASYLLHPALHGVNVRDFHQIAFATALLLFSLYFLEQKRDLAFLAFLLLALLTKEEVALSVAAIGLYILAGQRRPRLGIPVALFGLGYFVITTVWLFPWLGTVGPAETRYAGFLLPGKGLFQSLLEIVITDPLYPVKYVFTDQDKIIYLLQMLLPVLFLPLFAPLVAWVLAIPSLLLALMVAPDVDYGIGFHYPAHVIPFIFFLSVLALQRLRLTDRQRPALAASLLAVSLAMSIAYGQVVPGQIPLPASSPHMTVVEDFVAQIPEDVSISTMNNLAPHLTDRKQIYLFPIVADAALILFDSHPDANFWPHVSIDPRGEAIAALMPYLTSGEYGLVRQEDGVLLLQRKYDTAANPAAIATLLSINYPATALRSADSVQELADPRVSTGTIRVSTGKPSGQDDDVGLLFGPYAQMQPGRYRATYRLNLAESGLAGRVATIDIFSHVVGGPLAAADLYAGDFGDPGQYQDFVVAFEIREPLSAVEFRVLHSGLGTLATDGVHVEYVGPAGE